MQGKGLRFTDKYSRPCYLTCDLKIVTLIRRNIARTALTFNNQRKEENVR